MMSALFLLFLSPFIGVAVVGDRVVMTNTGPVQGITISRGNDLEVEAFLGIPFAEPPLGRLRFRRPVPKTPWNGVFDASSLPPTCIQNVTFNYYFEPNVENMTEDCLYLNLWIPYARGPSRLKPIIIILHGGAFNVGSSNLKVLDGTRMAEFGDVVVASMNYRVGVMGFFSGFIEDANGNMGIYDQLLGMHWIKDNARSFGGDPNHIVLLGESAGSMIIAGHIVSPMSRGMVKRAIMQSGTSCMPMILDENAKLYSTSQKLARLVGCADRTLTLKDDPNTVVQCLKRLPAEKLSAAEGLLKSTNPITFFPRVGDEFLPIPTIEDMKKGNFKDMELLLGINKEEGPFFLTTAAPQYFGTYGVNRVSTISKKFAHQLIRIMFGFLGQNNLREISDFYINTIENGTSDNYTLAIATSLGDFLINCATVFEAEYYSLRNPVYFYVFNRRSSVTPLAEWMETTHYDELQYVFGNPLFAANFTPEEEKFSRRMMARWISFAKTGDPNIPGEKTWPLFKQDNPLYMELKDEEVVRLKSDNYRCEFWRERFHADLNEEVYANIHRDLLTNSGGQSTTDLILKIASIFLASIWMI